MTWKSVAKWPYPDVRLGNIENLSEDTHDKREQAEAVAAALLREGFGGEGKIFPLKVWVLPGGAPTPRAPSRPPVSRLKTKLIISRSRRDPGHM